VLLKQLGEERLGGLEQRACQAPVRQQVAAVVASHSQQASTQYGLSLWDLSIHSRLCGRPRIVF
jgi:hypothetical protein